MATYHAVATQITKAKDALAVCEHDGAHAVLGPVGQELGHVALVLY